MKRSSLYGVRSISTVLCFSFTVSAHAVQNKTAAEPEGDAAISHLLNRLSFGPRPGDVANVKAIGANAWIAAQLQPETISDRAVEAKLSKLQTLRLSGAQLMLAYKGGQALGKEMKAAKNKTDLKVNARQKKIADDARASGFTPGIAVQAVGEMQTAKLVRAVESPRQLQEVLVDFWTNHFNLDVNKGAVRTMRVADERDAIRPFVFGKFRAMLGASAHSPAMLVYLDNARSTQEMEMPVRGKMRRAKLRNAKAQPKDDVKMAVDMTADAPEIAPKKRGGINENYARELMELHTLGVGGGYTQKDVAEVARCFTGWTIDDDGVFLFRARAHDNGEKIVLGQRIAAGGGVGDGERVLDILASSPSTAKFISRKLAIRFVADEPQAALVERAAQTFTRTGGDLRETVRTLVSSPEFSASSRQKIKSPFEFAVSSVRALGGEVLVPDTTRRAFKMQFVRDGQTSLNRNNNRSGRKTLASELALMGQPMFAFSAPTGYAENSQSWVSAGGLVARLNFALDLASDGVGNVKLDRAALWSRVDLNDGDAIINRLDEQILGGAMTPATRATLQKQTVNGTAPDANKLLALTLGAPEFQRR